MRSRRRKGPVHLSAGWADYFMWTLSCVSEFRRPIQGLRRMPSQAWHSARLGSILGTLVPFTSFCYQSTFFMSSSGGGLPGRLATLNRVETPVLF